MAANAPKAQTQSGGQATPATAGSSGGTGGTVSSNVQTVAQPQPGGQATPTAAGSSGGTGGTGQNSNAQAGTSPQPGGPTPPTVVKPDLTDLEDNVRKVTKKMCRQLASLKDSYASNQIIPDHLKRIFQNIMDRCYIEINFVRESNFADRRQTALRLMVDEKLDLLRKDISKLKKIVDDIQSLNKGNENHVCRDVKNFYSQVGRRNAF